MKHTKRLIALLLGIVLTFSLALPAFAEGDPPEEPDPAMPVITVQPKNVNVSYREKFTLSVRAYISNGDRIGYLWRTADGETIEDTSYPEFTRYSDVNWTGDYCVEVYNRDHPEYRVTSETVHVEVHKALHFRIRDNMLEGIGNLLGDKFILSVWVASMIGTAGILGILYAPINLFIILFEWIASLFKSI